MEQNVENIEMDEKFKTKVEEKVADRLSINYKLTNDISTFIARLEALNIVVAILNAFLGERQKGENKLSDEELGAIQAAVTAENAKTEDLYKVIDAVMNKNKKEEF